MTTAEVAGRRKRLERATVLFWHSLTAAGGDQPVPDGRARGRQAEACPVPHAGPDGADARVSARTMNRVEAGLPRRRFERLVTPPRRVEARTPEQVLTLAALSGRTRSGGPPMSGGSSPGCLDGRPRTGRCSGCSPG